MFTICSQFVHFNFIHYRYNIIIELNNTHGSSYCNGVVNGLALMNDITFEESIELCSLIKNLMNKNNGLLLVTHFEKIIRDME